MKNRLFILFIVMVFVHSLLGSPYSPATRRLIEQTKSSLGKSSGVHIQSLKKQYPLHLTEQGVAVSAFVQINDAFDFEILERLNIKLRVASEGLLSIQSPVCSLEPLGKAKGVRFIEVDSPVFEKMDEARSDINADQVHNGNGLNMAYTGTDVLIGIIDSGFDYTHPAFDDENGQSRILRVWDQRDNSGTPPSISNTGSEYSGNAIVSKAHDSSIDGELATHGTQVAGPAVGYGADSNGAYGGIAPDANIVFVSHGEGATSVFEALEYVFDIAESMHMPAVANISFGNHQGPHDGTSTIDQYIDRVSGPGRIVVGSAGNEGDETIHVSHTFSGETIRVAPETIDGETVVDIWGTPSKPFEVSIGVVNAGTHQIVAQTSYFSTTSASYQEGKIYGASEYVLSAVNANPNNQRPNMQVWIKNTDNYPPVLLIKSNGGSVNMWNLFDGIGFTDFGRSDLYTPGDNASSIDEICATSKSIIAVGAYITKKVYKDINNSMWQINTNASLYDIADFSSRGPTIDGRTKPDICAPGEVLVIPFSSYTTETIQENMIVEKVQGFYPYGAFNGTSFAAPVVAGVIGLMLEANPTLDPDDIKSIFRNASTKDNFTQSVPNNTWGLGKVNAYNSVSRAETYSDVPNPLQPKSVVLYPGYPNPFNPVTSIAYTLSQSEKVRLAIFNQNGQLVDVLVDGQQSAGTHQVTWQAEGLSSGLYFCRMKTRDYTAVQKLVLMR